MREIKFKAYDKLTGKFHLIKRLYFNNSRSYTSNTLNISYADLEDVPKIREANSVEIMEFTGCKDAKKCDIYEGDICQFVLGYKTIKCAVYFKDGCFYLNENDENGDIQLYHLIHEINQTKIEIIGNIYDA